MSVNNKNILNHVLQSWPKGTVAVYSFLKELGVSYSLTQRYLQSGWIKSIGSGAFVRSDDKNVEWPGSLYAIQKYENSSIHVGGITALEYSGFSHYVRADKKAYVVLYGNSREKLPSWFVKHLGQDKDVLLFLHATNLFDEELKDGLTPRNINGVDVVMSSPERAMMEILYSLPKHTTFEGAKLLMEGLATLRPDMVQKLLEGCKSVKVKRLFMFLAEYCDHAWLKEVNVTKVRFGSGKRVIAKDGYLDFKYHITVPKEFKK